MMKRAALALVLALAPATASAETWMVVEGADGKMKGSWTVTVAGASVNGAAAMKDGRGVVQPPSSAQPVLPRGHERERVCELAEFARKIPRVELDGEITSRKTARRVLQPLLNRQAIGLTLPADKRTAVIFDGQRVTRHQASVAPRVSGRPRANSAKAMSPLPAR